MSESLFTPLVMAAVGVLVAFATSVVSTHRIQHKGSVDQTTAYIQESLQPKTEDDADAKARLPYLMMRNGSYPLGKVALRPRQSGF